MDGKKVSMGCPVCRILEPIKNGILNVKVENGEMKDFYIGGSIMTLACGHKLQVNAQVSDIKEEDLSQTVVALRDLKDGDLQTKPSDTVTLRS